jgi:hypothetical protein
MSTLFVSAADHDAITPDEWAAIHDETSIPVRLGEPARLRGNFDNDGNFVLADDGPEWCVWDDPRLTEDHAVAVAAALED